MPLLRLSEPYDRNRHWRQGKRPAVAVDARGRKVSATAGMPRRIPATVDELADEIPVITDLPEPVKKRGKK